MGDLKQMVSGKMWDESGRGFERESLLLRPSVSRAEDGNGWEAPRAVPSPA